MKNILILASAIILFTSCAKEDKEPATQVETDDIGIISTDFGEVHILLYDDTPKHKENFLKLANEGFYDSTTFHRVMNEFMIQGGDPNSKDDLPFNDGQGGPGYTIDAEFVDAHIHKRGAVAAARLGDQQNPERKSSGSQFYLVHGKTFNSMELDQILNYRNESKRQEMIRAYVQMPEQADILTKLQGFYAEGNEQAVMEEIAKIEPIATEGFIPFTYTQEQRDAYATEGGYAPLDGFYTVFGEVIKGMDVVDAIAVTETAEADRPVKPIPMKVMVKTLPKSEIETEYDYSYN